MTIKEAVAEVLTLYTKARDDDNYLYILVARLLGKMGSEWDLYWLLSRVDYESVRRSRQRLQAKYPDVRWEKYQARHKLAEKKRKEYSPTYLQKLTRRFIYNN